MRKFYFVTLLSLILTSVAYGIGDEGFPDPQSAATAFLQPLTKGKDGIKESIQALPGEKASDNTLIKEAKKDTVRPMESAIRGIMQKSGKLMYFRKTGEEIKFGGKMVKQFYDLHFHNGPKKELMIVILQPTMSGGYHIMDAQITDEVDLSGAQAPAKK